MTLKTDAYQIGNSLTASQNFSLEVPAVPDGTVKLVRGNAGAGTQDILSVDANGLVAASQGSYGGLRLMTAVASTSGTSIDFTSIPSWARRITVMLSGVSTNGTNTVYLRMGDSGGIESSGYEGAVNNYNGGAVANLSGSFSLVTSNVAAQVLHGVITLTLLNPSTNLWAATSIIGRSDSNTIFYTAGSKALSATLDRLQIGAGGDAFDAGTINVMYEG